MKLHLNNVVTQPESKRDILRREIPVIYADIDNIFEEVRWRLSEIVNNINESMRFNPNKAWDDDQDYMDYDESFAKSFVDTEAEAFDLTEILEGIVEEFGFDMCSVLNCFHKYVEDYCMQNGYPDLYKETLDLVDEILLVDKVLQPEELELLIPINDNIEVPRNGYPDDIPSFLDFEIEYDLSSDFEDLKPLMDNFVSLYRSSLASYLDGSSKRNRDQLAQIFSGLSSVSIVNVERLDNTVLKLKYNRDQSLTGKGKYRLFMIVVSDENIKLVPIKKTKKNQNNEISPSHETIRKWAEKAGF